MKLNFFAFILCFTIYGYAASSEPLVICTALSDAETSVYLNDFEKKTGIKVKHIALSAGEMLNMVLQAKGTPDVSIMYGGPLDTYIAAMDKGLLSKYVSGESKSYPKKYIDKNGYWSGIYIGIIGFMYNEEVLRKNGASIPTSWADLIKPEYKGLIMMANPASSGTAYTIVATLVQMMGEEKAFAYMENLNKNIIAYTTSGSAPGKMVSIGAAGVGILFIHDALRYIDGIKDTDIKKNMQIQLPLEGTGYEIGCLAILKGAPARKEAERFVDFMLSVQGQEVYTKTTSFRMPVRPGVSVMEGSIRLEDCNVIDYDFNWAGKNRNRLSLKWNRKILLKENR